MAYKKDAKIATIEQRLKERSRALIDAIDGGYQDYLELTDAQNGQSVQVWTMDIYDLGDTKQSTLTVTASTRTISCLTGAGLFANFRVGRNVYISGFTNAGNNQSTVEIAAVTDDSITLIDSSSGWVDETDENARVREIGITDETDKVNAIITTKDRFKELKDALDNVAVTTADRRNDLMDWIW